LVGEGVHLGDEVVTEVFTGLPEGQSGGIEELSVFFLDSAEGEGYARVQEGFREGVFWVRVAEEKFHRTQRGGVSVGEFDPRFFLFLHGGVTWGRVFNCWIFLSPCKVLVHEPSLSREDNSTSYLFLVRILKFS